MTRRFHKSVVLAALLVAVFATILSPVLPLGGRASAATAPTDSTTSTSTSSTPSFDPGEDQHIDRSTILYNGIYYFDDKLDDDYTYKSQKGGQTEDCTDKITDLKNGNKNATLTTYKADNINGGCTSDTKTITLTHTARSYMPFAYRDAQTIVTSDLKVSYKYDETEKLFLEQGTDTCKDSIKVASGDRTKLEVTSRTDKNNKDKYNDWADQIKWNGGIGSSAGGSCFLSVSKPDSTHYFASTVVSDNPNATGGSPTSTSGAGNTNGNTLSLDCKSGYNPLNWLICGIIDGMVSAIGWVDNMLNGLLSVGTSGTNGTDPIRIFSTSDPSGKGYFEAWKSFRNMALGLLVIIGLVIIIAQEIGSDFVDAYTVRKTLPRLVVAAVGITLSWQLMRFFVELTNSIGFGLRALIYAPFTGGGAGQNQAALGGGGDFAVSLIAGIAGAALGIFGLLSFVATAALAVFVAFVVLILRQIIIILLVMLAPIAIVAYILPNTKKIYDIWWDAFSKALLMFPLISALIAAGRVFSYQANLSASTNNGSVSAAVQHIIAYIAYFAPYFLIPFTLKFAGGALARLGAITNNPTRGAFNRLSNFRANQSKKRMTNAAVRAQTGNTFKRAPIGTKRDKLNRGIMGAAMVGQAGFDPRHMRTNVRTAMRDNSNARVDEYMKSASFNAWAGDDDKVYAAAATTREGIASRLIEKNSMYGEPGNAARLDEAVSQILRSQNEVDNPTFQKARVRAMAKTGTGYQYTDSNGVTRFDATRVLDDINSAYGNDRNGAVNALAEIRSSLTNSGQIAGVAGFGAWAGALEGRYGDKGKWKNAEYAHDYIMADAISSASPAHALHGKPASAAEFGIAHGKRITALANRRAVIERDLANNPNTQYTRANLDAATDELSGAVASAAGIYDAMAQASPQNASAMANQLMSLQIDGPSFNIMRREARMKDDGTPELDANNHPIYDNVAESYKPNTIREYIETQMDSNPAFVNRRKDFGQSTLAQAAQQSAAARAESQLREGGNPFEPPKI